MCQARDRENKKRKRMSETDGKCEAWLIREREQK
jgi:hypothetical protein